MNVAMLLLAVTGCRGKQVLSSALLGPATIAVDASDEVVLRVEPYNADTCIDALDERRTHATANGRSMRLTAPGGYHDTYLPQRQRTCDVVELRVRRRDVPVPPDGTVAIELRDGVSTFRLAWSQLFAPRTLSLVQHAATVRPGERLRLRWTPLDDDLEVGAGLQVCFEPVARAAPCWPTGAGCVPAARTGRDVDFTVPQVWACSERGTLSIRDLHATARATACDPRLTRCTAEIAGTAAGVEVWMAR